MPGTRAASSEPELSVVVVSYNTRRLLDECLRSIADATPPENGIEVIVVDNASSDGSREMVREKHPQARLITHAENRGFSVANNSGLDVARGRVLLFLNSDTRVGSKALIEPLEHLLKHPEVGAITVKLVTPNGERDPDNHRGFPTPWNAICHFCGLGRLFPGSPRFNGYLQTYLDLDVTHPVDVVAGSFLMMPKSLLRELGGWDETYFFYGEDIDLCYRIRRAGYSILYYPHVEVVHHKGASSGLRGGSEGIARPPKEIRVKAARESVRAMKIFYRQFYGQRYSRLLTWIVLAGIQVRGGLRVLRHQLS